MPSHLDIRVWDHGGPCVRDWGKLAALGLGWTMTQTLKMHSSGRLFYCVALQGKTASQGWCSLPSSCYFQVVLQDTRSIPTTKRLTDLGLNSRR